MTTPPTLHRDDLRAAIETALAAHDWARALWEGGSAAFGRDDPLSDVDLMAVVDAEHVDEAFAETARALEAVGTIARAHRLPEPTWHGHAQSFYLVAEAGPFALVDLVVMADAPDERFLVEERHGRPAVRFDRDGVVRPLPLDRPAHAALLARRRRALAESFPLFQGLVTKELRRGRAVDALSFFHGLCLRPLVELLRIRHDPERHDYGLRYVDHHLPAEVAAELAAIAYVADPEDLAGKHARAIALFEETLAALEAEELDEEDDAGSAAG